MYAYDPAAQPVGDARAPLARRRGAPMMCRLEQAAVRRGCRECSTVVESAPLAPIEVPRCVVEDVLVAEVSDVAVRGCDGGALRGLGRPERGGRVVRAGGQLDDGLRVEARKNLRGLGAAWGYALRVYAGGAAPTKAAPDAAAAADAEAAADGDLEQGAAAQGEAVWGGPGGACAGVRRLIGRWTAVRRAHKRQTPCCAAA
jgi:hypothetical protein